MQPLVCRLSFLIGALCLAAVAARSEVGYVASESTTASCQDARVAGTYAYLACADSGLGIFDLTDPLDPELVTYVDTPGTACAVDVLDSYAYVADTEGGVAIINIATPATAYKVCSFHVGHADGGVPLQVTDVAAVQTDGHTYLGLAAGTRFFAARVSTPTLPKVIYTNTLSGYNSVTAVETEGSRIWAACGQDGLRAYEFDDAHLAGAPVLSRQSPVAEWDDASGDARDVAFDPVRQLAFVARGESGLTILNLTTNPLQALHSQPLDGFALKVAARGTNVYVTSLGSASRLACFNTADPARPFTWWIYEAPLPDGGNDAFRGLDASGSHLVAAVSDAGFALLPLGAPIFVSQGFVNPFPTLRLWTGGNTAWVTDTNDPYSAPTALRSGTIGGLNHASWLETRVQGPGTLHFQWQQTGSGPFFQTEVDGYSPGGYSSSLDWRFDRLNLTSGWHTVRWIYSDTSTDNPWSVAMLDNVTWVPNGPGVVPLGTAADADSLAWTTGGHGAWTGQVAIVHDQTDALDSGVLSADETNWVETVVQGPGSLSFWWKGSTDNSTYFNNLSKEPDDMGDVGSFLLGGNLLRERSGEWDWTRERLLVPDGPQVLRWRFGRDSVGSIGADAVWVDQVDFQPGLFPAIELKGLLEFRDVAVGARKTKKMSVINPGRGPLRVSAIACTPGYSATPQAFTVPPGQTQKVSVVFAPLKLGVNWGSVTVKSNARAGVNVKETAGVGNGPGVIRMAASTAQILEGYTLEVRVRRVLGDMGGVSVSYATRDGTARAGRDYTAVSGTLTWFYGDSDEQVIEVPVRADALNEGDETFQVILSNPANGARLGSPAQTTVTIRPYR